MATEESTRRLLSAVWGQRNGFVFLPYKDDGGWHEPPGVHINGSPSKLELPDKVNLYFCPVVFTENHRRKEYAGPTDVLWADLDPIHPDNCKVRPSIAWESSPGRYQALWFLEHEIAAEEASLLSKRIAYADGADKGGWDVTQVLRVPGTRNYKYDSHPPVRLMWAKQNRYAVDDIKKVYPPVRDENAPVIDAWPSANEALIQATLKGLPRGTQQRITRERQGADRSLELQKLARDLLRAHIEPAVVAHLLQRSVFNKFRGRSDEHRQLLKQVTDAQTAVAAAPAPSAPAAPAPLVVPEGPPLEGMRVEQWTQFLQKPTTLRWLVEDSWVDQTVGFISGRAKSYKTWIALDLALSILSGKPFLNQFPVGRTGPVVLVQEEDPTAVLQERIKLVGKQKDMLPSAIWYPGDQKLKLKYPDYPLHIINLQGFSLGSAEKVVEVRQLIAEVNPVLVILDPLVVMLGSIDEYRATEVSGMLQTIKYWREEFGCSVAVVHHWNKAKAEEGERGGQHMYGSFAFHAWLESGLHVSPIVDEQQEQINSVVIEREFKAAPSKRALKVNFNIDSVHKYSYLPVIEQATESPLALKLLDLVIANPGIGTAELMSISGYSRPRVSEALAALVRTGKIKTERGGGRGHSSKYLPPEES